MSVWLPTDSIYDVTDYNKNIDYKATVAPTVKPGSIVEYLRDNGFRYFYHLIYTSGMQDQYERDSYRATILAPADSILSDKMKNIITNATKFTAINLLRFATIPYCLDRNGVLAMRGNMVPTADQYKKLFISCDGVRVKIDNTIDIVGINESFLNKTLLVTSNLLVPTNML